MALLMMVAMVAQEVLAVVGIVLVVEMVVLDRGLAGSPYLVVFCLHHHNPAESQSSFSKRLDADGVDV